MRFLSIVFFLFIIVSFNNSCGLFSADSDNEEEVETGGFTGISSVECSSSQRCKEYCNKWFSAKSSLFDRCLDQESDDVTKLNAALSSMDKGNWDSIKKEDLSILTKFDEDLWPQYASVNSKVFARDMLLWVAKNEEIADHLDEDGEVLKNAFTVLGAPVHKKDVVFESMKVDVDLDNRRTFFEVSVFDKNDKAFTAAHDLLKKECDSVKSCIKKVYCDIDATQVFGKLNELELGGDADDGDNLHRDECD